MDNLLEYRHNYSMTSGSLCNCYRDKINDVDVNNYPSHDKSFGYKTKIVGETPGRPP